MKMIRLSYTNVEHTNSTCFECNGKKAVKKHYELFEFDIPTQQFA